MMQGWLRTKSAVQSRCLCGGPHTDLVPHVLVAIIHIATVTCWWLCCRVDSDDDAGLNEDEISDAEDDMVDLIESR